MNTENTTPKNNPISLIDRLLNNPTLEELSSTPLKALITKDWPKNVQDLISTAEEELKTLIRDLRKDIKFDMVVEDIKNELDDLRRGLKSDQEVQEESPGNSTSDKPSMLEPTKPKIQPELDEHIPILIRDDFNTPKPIPVSTGIDDTLTLPLVDEYKYFSTENGKPSRKVYIIPAMGKSANEIDIQLKPANVSYLTIISSSSKTTPPTLANTIVSDTVIQNIHLPRINQTIILPYNINPLYINAWLRNGLLYIAVVTENNL